MEQKELTKDPSPILARFDDTLTHRLLAAYRYEGDASARVRLIELHLPLAARLARRFTWRGEPLDDLVQIAAIGLMKAVDRFRPEKGSPFLAFAVPTILGELRRHHRDRTWPVRLPRRLSEDGCVVTQVQLAAEGDEEPGVVASCPDAFEATEDRVFLASGVRALDERERRLVHLYFFLGLSQARIAEEMQLSQVHVSRLLRGALVKIQSRVGALHP